jgi:hypothetical protein
MGKNLGSGPSTLYPKFYSVNFFQGNLLHAGDTMYGVPTFRRRSKFSAGFIYSPWKAGFMRQHNIEMNWRLNPVKSPKVRRPPTSLPIRVCTLKNTPLPPFEGRISANVVWGK